MLNENDFESPGYEYLRSYQNMSNLYYKLVALNYQRDFCSLYRCPPIHKYYFSLPSKNQGEQQFLFTCLCAWLIKDKCQMNLELEPEEYEDPDVVVGVILEALRLLLTPDDDQFNPRAGRSGNLINFPPARLKLGFGPEVIWTMNILADRSLELLLESDSSAINRKINFIYNNKSGQEAGRQTVNSITIGQPFVGGGLTTRPLGSYQVDDATLLFDDDEDDNNDDQDVKNNNYKSSIVADNTPLLADDMTNPDYWYEQVDRTAPALESARLLIVDSNGTSGVGTVENWQDYLQSMLESKRAIQGFINNSRSLLHVVGARIDRHLQVIRGREKFIQTNLRAQIEEFLKIWRDYSIQSARQSQLVEQVNVKTDKFESYNDILKRVNGKIELRIKELNDGSKLRGIEHMIDRLKEENGAFDVKIGLLLSVYAKQQSKIVSNNSE